MDLECVIICVNYDDFLSVTLPRNMQHFDRIVVVTSHADLKTKALCSKWGVDCIPTNCFYDDGDKFNKSRGINLGIGHLKSSDWILHLDADIVLPHNFRHLLKRAHLNAENIYGADRQNVFGYDHWETHKHKLEPHYKDKYFVDAVKEFPMGARIVHSQHGYSVIGYFQLWHKSKGHQYPHHQGSCEHDDLLFSCLWPRKNRILLPEIFVYHLESGDGPVPMGLNWNGRKSPPFGPEHKHHKHHRHPCYCPKE